MAVMSACVFPLVMGYDLRHNRGVIIRPYFRRCPRAGEPGTSTPCAADWPVDRL